MAMPIKSRLAFTVGLGLVGLMALVGRSSGQQDGGVQKASSSPAAGVKASAVAVIGTIDMESALKQYEKYKSEMDAMKAEVLGREKDLMKISEEGKQVGDMMGKFQPGSPDFKRLENKLSQLKAQFQVAREQAQSELAQREADVLAKIIGEIQGMSAAVAKRHGMTFVVRATREPINSSNPNSVMEAMSRAVVYSDPTTDITNEVVNYLNYNYRRATGADAAAKPASATKPASR